MDNMSVITALSTPEPTHPMFGKCYEMIEFMRIVADVWISIPLCVLGIIGNIIAFVVMWTYRQKLTTTIFLQALAILDTLILAAVIPLRSLRVTEQCFDFPYEYKETWKIIYRWGFPPMFALKMMETWFITLLTFDRWIAVCKPLHAQRLCTPRAAYKRIGIIVILSILLSLPLYFESRMYGIPEDINPQILQYPAYVISYRLFFLFIYMYLVPTIALIVLNIKLLSSLRWTDSTIANRRHSQSMEQSQQRSITMVVVSVVTIYFLCSVVAMISQIMFTIEFCFPHMKDDVEMYRRPLSNINNVAATFNSAINFFIYSLCSRNFRSAMFRLFGCKRKFSSLRLRTASRTSSSNGTLEIYSSLLRTSSNQVTAGKCVKQISQTDTM